MTDRVLVAPSETNWISANRTLSKGADAPGGDAWKLPGGDWIDRDGTANGPNCLSVAAQAGVPLSVDISRFAGDLILRGVRVTTGSVTVDGGPAVAFWNHPSANTNFDLANDPNHVASLAGSSVFVTTRGKTLTFTPYAAGTLLVALVAGPVVLDYPLQGPSGVTPTLADLEMIDGPTITGRANCALPYAYNPEFSVDPNGFRYLRFSCDPALKNPRLISWYLTFSPVNEAWARWCLYIEDDVAPAFNEVGMKLPGLTNIYDGTKTEGNETVSLRMLHSPPGPRNGGLYGALSYEYSIESGAGYGKIVAQGPLLRSGRWYVFEQYVKLNSFAADGTPNGDGILREYLDGALVRERTDYLLRKLPQTRLVSLHLNVYHGGIAPPKALMHYRIGGIGVHASRIGLPNEMLAAQPQPDPGTTTPPEGNMDINTVIADITTALNDAYAVAGQPSVAQQLADAQTALATANANLATANGTISTLQGQIATIKAKAATLNTADAAENAALADLVANLPA